MTTMDGGTVDTAPVTLQSCSICEKTFSRPSLLSQHLDCHGIEWKTYWNMYLHHVSGLICTLCGVAHADVYSLESHLKINHCIKAVASRPSRDDTPGAGVATQDSGHPGSWPVHVVDVEDTDTANGTPVNRTSATEENVYQLDAATPIDNYVTNGSSIPQASLSKVRASAGRADRVPTTTNWMARPAGAPYHARGPARPGRVTGRDLSAPPTDRIGPGHMPPHVGPVDTGAGGTRSVALAAASAGDEVTEVGRVVTVPLDGAPLSAPAAATGRRKRRAGQRQPLDVIEILDVEPTPPAALPRHNGPPLFDLSHDERSDTARQAETAAAKRPRKPTAVISPYESTREPRHQTICLDSVTLPSNGEIKLPTVSNGTSAPSAGVHPAVSAEISQHSDDSPLPLSTAPVFSPSPVVPPYVPPSSVAQSPVASEVTSDVYGSSANDPASNPTITSLLRARGRPVQRKTAASAAAPSAAPPTRGRGRPVQRKTSTGRPVQRKTSTAAAAAPPAAVRPVPSAASTATSSTAPAAAPPAVWWPVQDAVSTAATRAPPATVWPVQSASSDTAAATPSAAAPPAVWWPAHGAPSAAAAAASTAATAAPPATVSSVQNAASTAAASTPPAASSPATGWPAQGTASTAAAARPAAAAQHVEPAAARSLSPWLDPVYQPGTLTRLSEQAAALERRRGRPERGPAAPVLRLLAAAESDQLSAGGGASGASAEYAQSGPGAAGDQQRTAVDSVCPEDCTVPHDTVQPWAGTSWTEHHKPASAASEDGLADAANTEVLPKQEALVTAFKSDPSEFETAGSPFYLQEADSEIDIKIEAPILGLSEDEPVYSEPSAGSPMIQLHGIPACDPLAVDDMQPAAEGGGSDIQLEDSAPQPDIGPPVAEPHAALHPAPAAAPVKRRPGRPLKRPVADGGGTDAPGGDGTAPAATARQDSAGRRRRRKTHWTDGKKKKKGRPLYSKPQGTGDGEIDPGNMVEVLFLNDDDGQEDYDAMDAMVMKVDMTERPTRYYVHFTDTSHKHDRWVTRPDISRVYRSQLRTLNHVGPAPNTAAAAVTADDAPAATDDVPAGSGGIADVSPAPAQHQPGVAIPDARSGVAPAEKTAVRTPDPRRRKPGPKSRQQQQQQLEQPSRSRRLAFEPERRLSFEPFTDETTTATLTAAPDGSGGIQTRHGVGQLVQVVYEVTADGAQVICPAKILRVNTELRHRRYLVHYLGWQRRYREWVTETIIRRLTPLQPRNGATGQILRRCVLPPPKCAESARPLYGSLRPCSVDLSAGNLLFLAATRPRPYFINDVRIGARAAARRPRCADTLATRTER